MAFSRTPLDWSNHYNQEISRSKAEGLPAAVWYCKPEEKRCRQAGSLAGGNGIRRQERSKLHGLDLRARLMSVFGLEGAVLLAALSPAAWYNIGLVVVLVALAIAVVMAYHVWHEVNEEIEPATPEELLASFEQARSEGELDDEEYARVRREIEKTAARPPASKPARRDDQAST